MHVAIQWYVDDGLWTELGLPWTWDIVVPYTVLDFSLAQMVICIPFKHKKYILYIKVGLSVFKGFKTFITQNGIIFWIFLSYIAQYSFLLWAIALGKEEMKTLVITIYHQALQFSFSHSVFY